MSVVLNISVILRCVAQKWIALAHVLMMSPPTSITVRKAFAQAKERWKDEDTSDELLRCLVLRDVVYKATGKEPPEYRAFSTGATPRELVCQRVFEKIGLHSDRSFDVVELYNQAMRGRPV